jgi:hypothetical protein
MRPDVGLFGEYDDDYDMFDTRNRFPAVAAKRPFFEARQEAPWTVGRIIRCTKHKINRMEEREPSLRRFLLVHKVMASIDDSGDADAIALDPAGRVRPPAAAAAIDAPVVVSASSTPLTCDDMDFDFDAEQCRQPLEESLPTVSCVSSGAPAAPHRRRRLATAGARPIRKPAGTSSAEKVIANSNRPIKKRRFKRLLGDAGCFAAAAAAVACGVK